VKTLPSEPLERQLISIMAQNREDAFGTQRKRFHELRAAGRLIKEEFGIQKWENLKARHVDFLVDHWKSTYGGSRTLDQKITHFRWLLGKIGKPILLPRRNAELGIAPAPRYTRQGNIVPDTYLLECLGRLSDARIRAAVLLARHLGLRMEEAALFRPWRDWQDDRVWVKRGTKGGRPRYLFLHNAKQRQVLELARSLTSGDNGLIPRDYPTYEDWRQHAYAELRKAGISREADKTFHDLRRTYIVERVHGLVRRGLEPARAAALVAREVGHSRIEVLEWYLADLPELMAAAPASQGSPSLPRLQEFAA
jgi:hypothetical protein